VGYRGAGMGPPTSTSNRTYDAAFAAYYDRLTGHKDYEAEVDALDRFLGKRAGRRLLDVGCGTGTHSALLAERGYDVTAIDLSPDMVEQAKAKSPVIEVVCCDVRELEAGPFSACISLFNVVNCLATLDDAIAFFGAIADRLQEGGVLLVEAWNPVAVIAEPPEVVERVFESGGPRITRTAVPAPDFLNQRLDLRYDIEVEDGESFSVTHELVLFTPLEVEFALKQAGFGHVEVLTALPELAPAAADDRMLAFTAVKRG
jgi:SAM-dependent methyltransferase